MWLAMSLKQPMAPMRVRTFVIFQQCDYATLRQCQPGCAQLVKVLVTQAGWSLDGQLDGVKPYLRVVSSQCGKCCILPVMRHNDFSRRDVVSLLVLQCGKSVFEVFCAADDSNDN